MRAVSNNTRAFSDMAIPPGEVLEEELEARGITREGLAASLGYTTEDIRELVKAVRPFTESVATGLEGALGISKQFWLGLEANYQATLARNRKTSQST